MNDKRQRTGGLRVKVLGLAGVGAFVTLGLMGLGDGNGNPNGRELAGSGDAPADTTYVQPTDNAMTEGATATWTTPTSVEATTKAAPKSGG